MTRLTDNDTKFGPFTLGRLDPTGWNPIRLVLSSGGGDEDRGCTLTAYAFRRALRVRLPQIIKPWRQWVDTSKYAWASGPNAGYWDVHAREYGFSLSEGFLQLFLGAQTHDSTTTQSWCKHLPWTQWHFHRHSYHGLAGELLKEWVEPRRRKRDGSGFDRFSEQRGFKQTMPKVRFEIEDYDGQRITATTLIEERTYTFGEGWFQWLRFFRRDMIRRSLSIEFSAEVGPEKGSWKGGTMGHGIEMLPGELHEQAFRRYCLEEQQAKGSRYRIKFVGVAQPTNEEPA